MIFLRQGKNRKKLLRLLFVTIFINFQLERHNCYYTSPPSPSKKNFNCFLPEGGAVICGNGA